MCHKVALPSEFQLQVQIVHLLFSARAMTSPFETPKLQWRYTLYLEVSNALGRTIFYFQWTFNNIQLHMHVCVCIKY